MEKTVPLVSKNWKLFCVFALAFHLLSIDSRGQAPPVKHSRSSSSMTTTSVTMTSVTTAGTTVGEHSFSYTLPAIDFGQVWIQPGQIAFRTYTVTLNKGETLDVDIGDTSADGANDYRNYGYEIDDDACSNAEKDGVKCQIVFGFVPTH